MNANSAVVLRTIGVAIMLASAQFAASTMLWRWGWQATSYSTASVFGFTLLFLARHNN